MYINSDNLDFKILNINFHLRAFVTGVIDGRNREPVCAPGSVHDLVLFSSISSDGIIKL